MAGWMKDETRPDEYRDSAQATVTGYARGYDGSGGLRVPFLSL